MKGKIIRANDDFDDSIKVKGLVEELKQLRFLKLNNTIKKTTESDSHLVFKNITNYEINIYRDMLTEAFNGIAEFKS